MSKSTRGIRAAGVASLAVTLSIGVAAPAFAVPGFEFDRIGGADRYETAALVADEYGAKPDAIIANGQPGFYADALASNYLSGVQDAPILLTRIKELPQATLDQLDQMNAENVTVVGGESVVPAEQVAQLESEGYNVTRIAGDDRFETNADVIGEGGPSAGGVGLIATGFNFPDALAAGPFAYAGHSLGLSTKDDVKDVVLDALEADGVEQVLIFGGTDAVGPGVEADLASRGITVLQRFAGSDRSETSELAAEWALDNLGFTDTHVGVASGYVEGYGADALAGGPLEGMENAPMLITRNVDNPDDVIDYLEAHSNTLETGHLFGGPAAISVAAEAAMTEAAQGEGNQDFTVTPSDQATFGASNDEDSDRTYTVSGLDDAETYNIALFPSENVDDSTAQIKFADADDNDVADFAPTGAYIDTVNNADVVDDNGLHLDAQPVNGTIKFTINSDTPTSLIPVVYLDADNGANDGADEPDLDLNADNTPSEQFGLGGETVYEPQAATAGPVTAAEVISNDEAANTFVAETTPGDASTQRTFSYDANDTYYIGDPANPANQVTLQEFELALNADDAITTAFYQTNPDFTTVWSLDDTAPSAPQNATATPTADSETTSLTVEWDAPAEGDIDSYNVYRASGAAADVAYPDDFTNVGTVDGDTLEFVDSGLSPNTTYTYVVTAVSQGQESDESNEAEGTTAATPPPALQIESADLTTDVVVEGSPDDGDVWTLVFDADASTVADDGVFRLQDGDGDIYQVQCLGTDGATGTPVDANTAAAACTLDDAVADDGVTNDELTVELVADPTDRNAAGAGTLTYPSTIVNVANANVDLAGSADTTIN